ncbi:MAG TPA: OsmC family protein [bacterium]|jgi:putative redox protein|nr:OsmC family protein [bacterium]
MRDILVSKNGGKLAQSIKIGPHSLLADESVENQGEDLGPNPMEYLCAALGSCTALTAKLYAQRKNWPLENTEVMVTLDRQEELTVFDRKVKFLGALDQSQRDRLLEIVNHCPVHKVLTGKIRIDTVLLT